MPPLKIIQYIHKYIFLIIKNKFTLLINNEKLFVPFYVSFCNEKIIFSYFFNWYLAERPFPTCSIILFSIRPFINLITFDLLYPLKSSISFLLNFSRFLRISKTFTSPLTKLLGTVSIIGKVILMLFSYISKVGFTKFSLYSYFILFIPVPNFSIIPSL